MVPSGKDMTNAKPMQQILSMLTSLVKTVIYPREKYHVVGLDVLLRARDGHMLLVVGRKCDE